MPNMSGYELCRAIRDISNVPIIMISAKDEEIDKILGLELGSDDYISKPFSLREVTIISGYAQGVKNNVFEDQDKILDTIVNECNNFKKQLENIIYLSKLDTINETYNFKDNSLNNLIIDSLAKVDSIIILNEINIIYNPSEDIIIKVDKEKILRALTNVLSNCLKYTKDTIYVNTKKLDNEVKIQIYDNGNGFSEELLEKPFSGVVVGTKEGNGIGLSIIKKVIDTHKGSIRLENEKDYGAKYIIKLPI